MLIPEAHRLTGAWPGQHRPSPGAAHAIAGMLALTIRAAGILTLNEGGIELYADIGSHA